MRRKHKVIVQNYSKTIGGVGQAKYDTPDGPPVPVPCNVHPLDADLVVANGLQESDTRLVVADFWPGRTHSRISYQGAEWDQHAPPQVHDISTNAQSVQVIIKKRG